jgi:hypothetical protein
MRNRPKSLPLLGVIAATASLLAGCDDSRSPTAPTPEVSTNIAGAWTGTYSFTDPFEECFVTLPAQATFEQDGSAVRGNLSSSPAPCGLEPQIFIGSFERNRLVGKTFIGDTALFGTVEGTLSGATLEIGLGVNSFGYASEGTLRLRRAGS